MIPRAVNNPKTVESRKQNIVVAATLCLQCHRQSLNGLLCISQVFLFGGETRDFSTNEWVQTSDMYSLDLGFDILEWRALAGSSQSEIFRAQNQYPTGGGMVPLEGSRIAVLNQEVPRHYDITFQMHQSKLENKKIRTNA